MIGMLWFDNDPKTSLTEKIERAANYYREKHGQPATVCYVRHPIGVTEAAGLKVKLSSYILHNHFFLAHEDVVFEQPF